ncbi:hypothetical protein ES708_15985 [subsurface metagenome]
MGPVVGSAYWPPTPEAPAQRRCQSSSAAGRAAPVRHHASPCIPPRSSLPHHLRPHYTHVTHHPSKRARVAALRARTIEYPTVAPDVRAGPPVGSGYDSAPTAQTNGTADTTRAGPGFSLSPLLSSLVSSLAPLSFLFLSSLSFPSPGPGSSPSVSGYLWGVCFWQILRTITHDAPSIPSLRARKHPAMTNPPYHHRGGQARRSLRPDPARLAPSRPPPKTAQRPRHRQATPGSPAHQNPCGHVLHAPRSAPRRPAAVASPGPPPPCYPLLPAEVAMQRKPHWNPATILIRERVLWVTLGILVWVASTTLLLGTC